MGADAVALGPNRVGPNGFLQWLADGIKHVCKEDLVPGGIRRALFKLAPYLVILAFILPWAVMPFSSSLILADLNVGILYITAVTALTVVGVLMAGWASNDKWSLIGGIRSAAQIVSYEIPAGLSIFPVVLMTGTLSMQGIIRAQGWAPDLVHVQQSVYFRRRAYFVSSRRWPKATARPSICLKRNPNWWQVSRPNTRDALPVLLHGGMGQHVHRGAIMVTLFLGGWQFPQVTSNPVMMNALQLITFNSKCSSWCSSRCG